MKKRTTLVMFLLILCNCQATTIVLQTANTENLEDSYIESDNPNTNNGSSQILADVNAALSTNYSLIKFNISSIPSGKQIDAADLNLAIWQNNLDDATEGYYISTNGYNNETWVEEVITWNNMTSYNSSASDDEYFFGGAGKPTGNIIWNVKTIVSNAYNSGDSNVTIILIAHDFFGAPSQFDTVEFISKEYPVTLKQPMLTITYSDAPVTPSMPYSASVAAKSVVGLTQLCFVFLLLLELVVVFRRGFTLPNVGAILFTLVVLIISGNLVALL